MFDACSFVIKKSCEMASENLLAKGCSLQNFNFLEIKNLSNKIKGSIFIRYKKMTDVLLERTNVRK